MLRTSSDQCGTLQIGVFADNLKLPLREGIRKAAELGVDSFQMFTTHGEVLPEQMSISQRDEFRHFFEKLGLALSATCADFGGGFVDASRNEVMIPKMFAQVELANDLGTKIITTHIGIVPEKPNAVWDTLRDALTIIGAYAEKRGVLLATETGPESGPTLRALLDSLDTTSIRVNFDPANLVASGFDIQEALDALLPYIVHTHAKDARRYANGGGETQLGEGDVDWTQYIGSLKSAGYTGAFTIEREEVDDPIGEVQTAIAFLRKF